MKARHRILRPEPTPVFVPYDLIITVETEEDEQTLARLTYSNITVPQAVAKTIRGAENGESDKAVYALLGVIQNSLRYKSVKW